MPLAPLQSVKEIPLCRPYNHDDRTSGWLADLVVDDDVHCASSLVLWQLAHVQGFIDYTLAGEGAITVQQDAHCARPGGVLTVVLLGSDLAKHHWVYCLWKGRKVKLCMETPWLNAA